MYGCMKISNRIFDNAIISFRNLLYILPNIQDGIGMINIFYFCLSMTKFCMFQIGQKFRNLLELQPQNLYDTLKVQKCFLKAQFF